ncbi:SpaH/EbpB family LPXTG-anchored major pilin [Vagococcus fluvialis]|uniref:SpaH/EbpB family LPXTG-anchored major pilin n=1 Tax=Vagococcus fluvialis TaxID=2738 RepID=UPI003D129668
MKKTKNLSLLIMSITILVLGICSILIPGVQVQAADADQAKIILHKKQLVRGDNGEYLPSELIQNTGNEMTEFDKYQAFEGVEFSIYDATPEFYEFREKGNGGKGATAEEAIKRVQASDGTDLEGHDPIATGKTDKNGDLTFTVNKKSGSKDAVYLIVETEQVGVIRATNLVVGFPVYEMTADGKYTDNELTDIHIYPKNEVSKDGSIEVTKKASYDNSIYLDGAEFVVSKQTGEGIEYIVGAKDGMYIWEKENKSKDNRFKFITGNTYNPGADTILVTEGTGTGKLIINHMQVGKYTITETKAPDDAAMINDEISKEVEVGKDGDMSAEIDVINDKIKLDKSSDSNNQSVQIGQKIQYKIESTIPQGIQDTFPDGTRRYTSYKLIDKHSEELTFVNESTGKFAYSLKDGNKVIAPENYTIKEDDDKNGFTLEINADYLTELTPNNHLTFNYFMFLNEKAVPDKDYTNTANVETGDLTDETKPVTVKTGGAMFQKVDKDNKKTGLADAEFVITNKETKGEYVVVNETTKEITWTTEKDKATTFTSDKDGKFEVTGLKFGTYYLEETKAPDGYVLLKNPIEFTVDENSYNKKQTVEVVNKHKGSLPMTGGIGSIVFVVGGISAFGFAAFYFKKRLSEAK